MAQRPGEGTLTAATGPGRWAVAILALTALLVGVTLVLLAYDAGIEGPELWGLLACWVTLPYIGAGLIAWRRRPESRMGVLMVVAGFATAANFLYWSSDDLLFTIGEACDLLPPVLFLHVFLAFPNGWLPSRADRVVVGAAYGVAGLMVPALLLGLDAPRNRFEIVDAPDVAQLLLNVQLIGMSTLLLAGIGLLVIRRRRQRRPLRATVGWLVDAFAVGLLAIAVLLLAGYLKLTSLHDPLRVTTYTLIGLAPVVFLVGLLQVRLGQASVGGLVADLSANPSPTDLQGAVRRTLRDPSAVIAYWLPELDAFVDADGRRLAPAEVTDRSSISIMREDARVGLLLHDPGLDDEPELLRAVAAAVGMAIHNAQLQVELQARLADVRASRARIVNAGDAERRRIERDLHDGAQQRLVALSLALRRARGQVPGEPDAHLAASLSDASELVRDALAELRELARGLHPPALAESGLSGALPALADRSPVPVSVEEAPVERLPTAVEAAAYFIVSEALTNVAKHAPEASARVRVGRRPNGLQIEVADDGPGGARARDGSGLQGLEDRVAALSGSLRIDSAPGRGTRLEAWIPLDAGGADAT